MRSRRAVRARALTRVQWLLWQLADAPQKLRVEALADARDEAPCHLLKNLRSEPGLLVSGGTEITSFRLTLSTGMGARHGTDEARFVRSADVAVDRFHQQVIRGGRGRGRVGPCVRISPNGSCRK